MRFLLRRLDLGDVSMNPCCLSADDCDDLVLLLVDTVRSDEVIKDSSSVGCFVKLILYFVYPVEVHVRV